MYFLYISMGIQRVDGPKRSKSDILTCKKHASSRLLSVKPQIEQVVCTFLEILCNKMETCTFFLLFWDTEGPHPNKKIRHLHVSVKYTPDTVKGRLDFHNTDSHSQTKGKERECVSVLFAKGEGGQHVCVCVPCCPVFSS